MNRVICPFSCFDKFEWRRRDACDRIYGSLPAAAREVGNILENQARDLFGYSIKGLSEFGLIKAFHDVTPKMFVSARTA